MIPAGGVCGALTTNLDILPTAARLAIADTPRNPLDGIDIWPLLNGQQTDLTREAFLYFNDISLQCARLGQWKLHVARFNTPAFTPYHASRASEPTASESRVVRRRERSRRESRPLGEISGSRSRHPGAYESIDSDISECVYSLLVCHIEDQSRSHACGRAADSGGLSRRAQKPAPFAFRLADCGSKRSFPGV